MLNEDTGTWVVQYLQYMAQLAHSSNTALMLTFFSSVFFKIIPIISLKSDEISRVIK